MPKIAPYGSWKSPITAALAAGGSMKFTGLVLDGHDLYWIESRPDEGGRSVVMRRSADGDISECTRPGYDVGTSVHEYGGGAFAVSQGTIYFTHSSDQRLYRQDLGQEPECLTQTEGRRYADLQIDGQRKRLICVQEDHTGPGEPANCIIAIDLLGRGPSIPLLQGRDFYSTPRLSPDGRQLAYLTWNHPNMPWDGCELHLALLDTDGIPVRDQVIAGGPTESVFQPEWSPQGALHFVAEHTGWWNLYRWRDGIVQALCPRPAEFGRAMWLFGYSTYGFQTEDRILCCYTAEGLDHLAWLDAGSGQLVDIASPYTEIDFLHCADGCAAFVGGAPSLPHSVVFMDIGSQTMTLVRSALRATVSAGYISVPQQIQFPSSSGRYAYAFYYSPQNEDFEAPPGQKAPLVVIGHGGPTSAASTSLRYEIQYWTSRGFGVADVNYGGSTGYGRDYRRGLNGQWGLVDVDDCCNAALALVERGQADRQRLIIKGRSAGGFTAFSCLVFRSEVFGAGVSHCGVAELEVFTSDTHKFESHYLETLVAPYPARKDLYRERSPIHYAEQLSCPLILFQGDEDKVVPPTQSTMMYEAVRRKGVPTAYVLLSGEGHVFRKAGTWKRIHEAELYFLSKVFEFDLPEEVEPVAIDNLSA